MGKYPQLVVCIYSMTESGQTSVITKKKKTQKFGSEPIARALAFQFPAMQGNCPTLPEPHNVNLSPRKKIGSGEGRWGGGGGGVGAEGREIKTKDNPLKEVMIVRFSEPGCPATNRQLRI